MNSANGAQPRGYRAARNNIGDLDASILKLGEGNK